MATSAKANPAISLSIFGFLPFLGTSLAQAVYFTYAGPLYSRYLFRLVPPPGMAGQARARQVDGAPRRASVGGPGSGRREPPQAAALSVGHLAQVTVNVSARPAAVPTGIGRQ